MGKTIGAIIADKEAKDNKSVKRIIIFPNTERARKNKKPLSEYKGRLRLIKNRNIILKRKRGLDDEG